LLLDISQIEPLPLNPSGFGGFLISITTLEVKKMSIRYIFNPDNFDGTCLTTIDSNTGKIAYTQLNWDEYNAAHGSNLQALEWDDFYHNWIKPHELKLQGEWIECTEADYDEMLNILPPLKYREIKGFSTFFVGEATTGTLFQMYACKNGKYKDGFAGCYTNAR
jgi:hypothetical protein